MAQLAPQNIALRLICLLSQCSDGISQSDFTAISMTHYLLTDNTKIKKNEYNIPEPVSGLNVPTDFIDVVFVPLLAYDKKGNRVGS